MGETHLEKALEGLASLIKNPKSIQKLLEFIEANKWRIHAVLYKDIPYEYRLYLYKDNPLRKVSLIFTIHEKKLELREIAYYKYPKENFAIVFMFTKDEFSVNVEIDNMIWERDVYMVNKKFNLNKIAKILIQKNYPIIVLNKSKLVIT